MFLDEKHFQLQILLRNQLEGLLRARGRKGIMFPNLFELGDFAGALAIVHEIMRSYPKQAERMTKEAKFGIMIEHPGVIKDLKAADKSRIRGLEFVSAGTNDLAKYILGIDRTSFDLSADYDELHPHVSLALDDSIASAKALGLDISLCGDMGNDPFSLLVLMGRGIRSLSLTPDFVDTGRRIIRSVDIAGCEEMVRDLAGITTADQVRQTIGSFVKMQIHGKKWAGLEPIRELILDD